MPIPVFPARQAPTPAFSIEARLWAPVAGAGGLRVLTIVFQEDPATPDQADGDRRGGPDYAFPEARKEPLEDAKHVRNAVARFNQVKGVTDGERDEAWARITAAAKRFGVRLKERSWRDLNKPRG